MRRFHFVQLGAGIAGCHPTSCLVSNATIRSAPAAGGL
jgi:hypothetical protein